jgi:hypothetical protein
MDRKIVDEVVHAGAAAKTRIVGSGSISYWRQTIDTKSVDSSRIIAYDGTSKSTPVLYPGACFPSRRTRASTSVPLTVVALQGSAFTMHIYPRPRGRASPPLMDVYSLHGGVLTLSTTRLKRFIQPRCIPYNIWIPLQEGTVVVLRGITREHRVECTPTESTSPQRIAVCLNKSFFPTP